LAVRLDTMVSEQQELLLGEPTFAARVTPPFVTPNKQQELLLRLRNESIMPVRDLSVATKPSLGAHRAHYVADGGEVAIPLQVSETPTTELNFVVTWRTSRLDGRSFTGEIPLTLAVRQDPATTELDLSTSPYIVGRPVETDDMFFGRSNLIEGIKRHLVGRDSTNVILLEGSRRAGKTSILKYLSRDGDLGRDWLLVYCSLQGGEGSTRGAGLETREVFRLMARDIGRAALRPSLNIWPLQDITPSTMMPLLRQFTQTLPTLIPEDHPFEHFERFLSGALERIHPRRLLVMLDEFDKLQEGIDSGITSPQVPENIRYLLHNYPDFAAVLTGSRRLKRLRDEYWSALFGLGYRVDVGALSLADARNLVTEPVRGRLVFVPEARDQIVDLCARQPFLIQSLCNRIFDQAAGSGELTITLGAVASAAAEMVRDNEHFMTLWDYARTEVRRLILQLCVELADEPDPVTSEILSERLAELRVIRSSTQLSDDIAALRELDVLEERHVRGGMSYRVTVPLMATWIREHVDFRLQIAAARRESEESL